MEARRGPYFEAWYDRHCYAATVPPGTLMEIALTHAGAGFHPLMGSGDGVGPRVACGGCTSLRGRYFVTGTSAGFYVEDARGYQANPREPTPTLGGPDATYRVETRAIPFEATAALQPPYCEPGSTPGESCPAALPTRSMAVGDLDLYTFTSRTDQALYLGTRGIEGYRAVVLDRAAGPLSAVGPSGNAYAQEAGQSLLVLMQHIAVQRGPSSYGLSAWLTHDEREVPRRIPWDASLRGEIASVPDGRDSDYFDHGLPPAPNTWVRASAVAEAALLPALERGELLALHENGRAVIEYPYAASGPLQLDDARNRDPGTPVGGAAYGYTISLEGHRPEVATATLPLSREVQLLQGRHQWWEFAQPARSALVVAARGTADRRPGFQDMSGTSRTWTQLGSAEEALRVVVALQPGTATAMRTLGLREQYFRSLTVRLDTAVFDLSGSLPAVAEVEPNDTLRQAQRVSLGTTLTGDVHDAQGEDPGGDHFLVPLRANEALLVRMAYDDIRPRESSGSGGPGVAILDEAGERLAWGSPTGSNSNPPDPRPTITAFYRAPRAMNVVLRSRGYLGGASEATFRYSAELRRQTGSDG